MTKFGEQLQQEKILRYAAHYLNYEKLKKLIIKCKEEGEPRSYSLLKALEAGQQQNLKGLGLARAEGPLAEFVYQWETDLKKVNNFAVGRFKELENSIKLLRNQTQEDLSESDFPTEYVNIRTMADRFAKYLVEIHRFIQQNAIGFQKIVKKLDKELGTDMKTWMEIRLQREPFLKLNLSSMLVPLSDVFIFLRVKENEAKIADTDKRSGGSKLDEKWVPPQDFQRQTTKYWIPLEYAFELKVFILKYLPILIFDRDQETETDAHWISSVYLDNDQGVSYHQRLYKKEGAKLVRIRFYSQIPEKEVFIERKTHHESWVQAESTKERFSLKPELVNSYLSGDLDIDQYFTKRAALGKITPEVASKSIQLGKEILEFVQQNDLKPVTRTCYRRSAFQKQIDNIVRITFDIDLQLLNEGGSTANPEAWCLPPKAALTTKDIYSFPHAILEIKLQDHAPVWVDELLAKPYIVKVDNFSKFQCSMSLFHSDRLKVLPPWMEEPSIKEPLENWGYYGNNNRRSRKNRKRSEKHVKIPEIIITSEMSNEMTDNIPDLEQNLPDDTEMKPLNPIPRDLSGRPLPKPLKVVPKVEPKTYFANERTFIQWLSASLILVTLSLILINLGSHEALTTGLIILPVSILFTLYALGQFYWRARKINQLSPSGYYDPYGPGILVLCLVIALLAVTVILAQSQAYFNWLQLDKLDSVEWNLGLAHNASINQTLNQLNNCELELNYHTHDSFLRSQTYWTWDQGDTRGLLRFREGLEPQLTLKIRNLTAGEQIITPTVSKTFVNSWDTKLEKQLRYEVTDQSSSESLEWSGTIESLVLPSKMSHTTLKTLKPYFTNLADVFDLKDDTKLFSKSALVAIQPLTIVFDNKLIELSLEQTSEKTDLDFKMKPSKLNQGEELKEKLIACLS